MLTSHHGRPIGCYCSVSKLCPTLFDPMNCSTSGSSVHGDSPGKSTGVGCHALLQEIFPTQGSNPGLLHCRLILYCLSHQGSPRILEWVAYSFSRGSSQPRNRTGVSCIPSGFLTSWATREAQLTFMKKVKMLVAQSCLTLRNPMDYTPLGFSVPRILQARILEWVAIPFSRGSSRPRDFQVSGNVGRFFTVWV